MDSPKIICDGVLDRDNGRVSLTPRTVIDPSNPKKEWTGVIGGNLQIADKGLLSFFEQQGGRGEYALTVESTGNPAHSTTPHSSSR